jgi:predicted DNA-binding protein
MREIHEYEEATMALSVRLDPVLAARVEEESKRLGVSKSDLVKDALELRLGLKNPYDLLRQVRSDKPMGNPAASEGTGVALRAKLRAKRSH